MLEFRLLGSLEILADGEPVELRRQKPRTLLSLLLFRRGEVVSADALIEEVWVGRPPATARASLQNYVAHLRRALGAGLVVTHAPGYVLDLRAEQTDVGRFERLVAAAQAVATVDHRAARLREALALWRGPVLADVTAGPSLEVEAACLEELRLSALEQAIDAELEIGRSGELVSELEQLIAQEPFRERPRAQLMLALYRSGRQTDALAVYREARRMLVNELGLEPSGALREVEQAILRHDATLDRASLSVARAAGRKQVTILFADLVDSEPLAQRFDPETYRQLLDRYFSAARTAIGRHGGTVEKFIGDAVMAVFGIPTVHEDDALRALRAALDARAALADLNEELEREHGLRLETRIGLHTGEVFVGEPDSVSGQVTGATVTLAKRLEEAAPSGEIVLSAETLTLVRDAVKARLMKLGRPPRQTPTRAFRLLELIGGAPPIARYFDAPLIGRDAELAALRDSYRKACEDRRCQPLTIIGEPGVGKTRLAREVASELGDSAAVLVGRCVAYGEGATFLPLREIMIQAGNLAEALAGDPEGETVASRATELVGLAEGTSSLEEGFWAVRRLFAALARPRPLILVVEDMQWAESTLHSLVDSLAEIEAPILCLRTGRPELLEQQPSLETNALTLAPLTQPLIDQIVEALPGGNALPEATRAEIVEASGGNPLFAEQLLAHVQEHGSDSTVAVPTSLQLLIASRLDLLEPPARTVLERAAVIGTEFSRAALRALLPTQSVPALSPPIGELVRKGLVRPARDAHGEEVFRFHHVLVRDVAYSGTPKAERADLHELLGHWLSEQPGAIDEIVGYHLEQAVRLRSELGRADSDGDLRVRAGTRLASAALDAYNRGDLRASSELDKRAAAVFPARHQLRIEVLIDLPRALVSLGETQDADEVMREALRLANTSGEPRLEYHALVTRALLDVVSGRSLRQRKQFLDIANRALVVFEDSADHSGLAKTYRLLHLIHDLDGRATEALNAAERQVEHARLGRSGHERPMLDGMSGDAVTGPMPVTDGLRLCDELLAQGAGNKWTETTILQDKSLLTAMAGQLLEARALLANAYRTQAEFAAPRRGFTAGALELLADDVDAAEHEVQRELIGLSGLARLFGMVRLGEALYRQGRYSEAARLLATTGNQADEHRYVAIEARCLRAKLVARSGQTDAGEQIVQEGVALSETTDWLNLRGDALLNLAEVLRLANRPTEAALAADGAANLYKRKGNVVSARRAREAVDDLAATEGA